MATILLHADGFDHTLRATTGQPSTILTIFQEMELTDENVEILTDENGVQLSATFDNFHPFLLHAIRDDFLLNANGTE